MRPGSNAWVELAILFVFDGGTSALEGVIGIKSLKLRSLASIYLKMGR